MRFKLRLLQNVRSYYQKITTPDTDLIHALEFFKDFLYALHWMYNSFNRKWEFIIGILCFGLLVAGLAWLSSSTDTARKIQACNNVSSFEGRLDCYINFASLENDAAVCLSIPKVTAQEKEQLCSGQGSTGGFCMRAEQEDTLKEWYEKKILGKNKIREEMQDDCFRKMAASTGDPSICHRMNTQNDWHYKSCLIAAGERAGMNLGSSADICKKLEESARSPCLLEVVKKNGDAALCELIGESKNRCFFEAALAAKSHTICDNITADSERDSDFKNDCFVKTAMLLGDIAICEKTTHPDAIKNCAWRVFAAKPEVFRTRESCDRLGDELVRYAKPEMHLPYFKYVGFAGGHLTKKEVCMNQLQATKGDFSTCPNDLCKIAVAQRIPDEKLSVALCKKILSDNTADGEFDPELKKCTDRALAQQTDFSLCEVYRSMNIANPDPASARNECIGRMLDWKNGPVKTKSVSTVDVKHALDANPPKEDGEWMVYQNPVLNIQFRYPRHWGKLQWELDAESGYPPSDIEDIEALSFSWDGADSHNFFLKMEKPSTEPGTWKWTGSYPQGCAGEEYFFCKESIENAKFAWYGFVGCMGGPCGIRRELTMVIDGVVFPRIHIDYQIPSTQDSEEGEKKLSARVKNMNFPDEEKKLLREIDSFIDSIAAY